MRISDWSSAVCSSDLCREHLCRRIGQPWMFRQFMRPPCGMHARQVVEHLLRLRDTQHLARIAEAHAACDQIFEQQIRRRAAFARRRIPAARTAGRDDRGEFTVEAALARIKRGVVYRMRFAATLAPQRLDRKRTPLNSRHLCAYRMPSSSWKK